MRDGTARADIRLNTTGSITLGTTALNFVQFNASTIYTAGAGLTGSSTFDVVGTTDRITVNADSVDIAATYAGQTSITTLGTITTGTWHGSTLAVAYGGTNATDAATARSNLSAAGKATTAITAGTSYTFNHGLNSTDVAVATPERASTAAASRLSVTTTPSKPSRSRRSAVTIRRDCDAIAPLESSAG